MEDFAKLSILDACGGPSYVPGVTKRTFNRGKSSSNFFMLFYAQCLGPFLTDFKTMLINAKKWTNVITILGTKRLILFLGTKRKKLTNCCKRLGRKGLTLFLVTNPKGK